MIRKTLIAYIICSRKPICRKYVRSITRSVRKHMVTVEGDRLFNLKTTQWQEIEDLIVRTVEAADRIESELLERDDEPSILR